MQVEDVLILRALRRVTSALLSVDIRFRCYHLLMELPGISELYVWGRGRVRQKRLRPDTKLVIDGFGSSANSFCREAFLVANPQLSDRQVCSNFHSPRIVRKAAHRGLPCVVLIRDPRDAAPSLIQRFPGVRLESALRSYASYYRRLMAERESVVIAPFPLVISDFPTVMRRCNESFGVAFETGAEVPNLAQQAFGRIEDLARHRHGGTILERRISRPTSAREPGAALLRTVTMSEQRALDLAVGVWHDFLGVKGDD